jgi:WD40-like Beta Propeller Repeat
MQTKPMLCSIALVVTLTLSHAPDAVNAAHECWSAWSLADPVAEVNSAAADGCPIESRYGLSLYIASMRAGGLGGNDIWAADRDGLEIVFMKPWSAPTNLGPNVNTGGSETRASLSWDGRRLYFGRDGDIYSSTRQPGSEFFE